jgi:hypothetical protein
MQTAALLATTITLAAAMLQTFYLQRQVRSGAWPYVSFGVDQSFQHRTDEQGVLAEEGRIEILVKNDGVGPALIRSAQVKWNGEAMSSWNDLLQRAIGHRPAHLHTAAFTHRVLPASVNRDTAISAMRVSDAADARALSAALAGLSIDVCYCSVYDECWIASRGRAEARPVRDCSALEDGFAD